MMLNFVMGNRTLFNYETMEHCDSKVSHCDGTVNQVIGKVATCDERIYHRDGTVKCWDEPVKRYDRLRQWIFVI